MVVSRGAQARRWRLDFDAESRLRRAEVYDAAGARLWDARFEDYRPVGAVPFAHTIDLRFATSGARARLSFRSVELNPPLPPDVFVLKIPAADARGAGGRG